MEEDYVQRAAKLLLNGATMLHTKCPNCKDPIYKLRDDTYTCATCDQSVIFQSIQTPSINNQQSLTNDDPVQIKITQLSQQLDSATDPDEILKLATLIKKLQALE
ncbi:MAG: hypothetical protein GPJ54_12860 [Candidatus Heimdallarchaeota archaeon]|nr:hypothetical protein [Candidatus Heimdallarchaeota archaeon]